MLRRRQALSLRRERLELADGDFVDLDWTDNEGAPLVLVLHGLEGSASSPYVRGLMAAACRRGWQAVGLNFRSCSGEPNRCSRLYHSGETSDLRAVVNCLRRRYPTKPLAVVGYSLGGNVLLKWLGEEGTRTPITAAVAVSVPFLLERATARLNSGLSRLYQWWLLRSLRNKLAVRVGTEKRLLAPNGRRRWRTLREFDQEVTARLHGFADADDYYRQASSRQYLGAIAAPTLIVHARDDPFIFPTAIPSPEELAPSVTLELSQRGGHVGFIAGHLPGRARYWLDERIPVYLSPFLSRC